MSRPAGVLTRRRVLTGAAAALAAVVAACTRRSEPPLAATATAPGRRTLEPTPSCDDGDEPTPAQTEGPYFTPDSPEKSDLAADVGGRGTKLLLTGTVLSTGCEPVARALVDFWQADDVGNYDNEGYTLRGHQFTADDGSYTLTTVIPGLYPGRTRHIHVKVQALNGPVLTTQLYFPGEGQNASDGIYRRECEIAVRDGADGKAGSFDFVIQT
jgi:protocatechuate 3,4-dioxygenase beta subunit